MIEKKIGAKDTSHAGMIIGAIWIAGWSAWKFIARPDLIVVTDIIYSGIGIAACFAPVYFSILMDKIKDIRFGGDK
jgi:hypothetical protein